MNTQDEIQKFIEKVKKMEKGEKLDLSSDEDLSIGIMNLISIEEHLFFTFCKTRGEKYLELLQEVREIRKSLLKKIIKNHQGEIWCISKHLLAASMRLMEVGTKALTKEKSEEAKEMFEKSYKLYSLFWGFNLGLIKVEDVKHTNQEEIHIFSDEPVPKQKNSLSIFEKLGELVKKVVDCCKE